ncbi:MULTISPECIES: hypothetical protein [Streptomyces]|uniref:hypothetical protein n=1 Tax=Streptomyces TaxID=1883 RepID=UPI0016738CE8|nr:MULTISPECIES: hypothetical protein [Streptomyces]MBK3524860.1 hypothetical protein [Streptomyces sp. MBT70]GGR70871.1 hypothetical protein GCM10010236_26390 [Streptomyces eurythermus]
MTTTTITTSNGPRTVTVTEPVPGLHIYEVPTDVSPNSTYRWILAHHDGPALAAFQSDTAATSAAHAIEPLADWTRSQMTTANEISLGGRVQALTDALQAAGGQHPNA